MAVEPVVLNESPLYLRYPSIDKLPDLLEALAKTGEAVAGKLTRAAERAASWRNSVRDLRPLSRLGPPALRAAW
jgi:hypothetical protein